MHITSESKSIIDKLKSGTIVKSKTTTINPLEQICQDVLGVIITNYEKLNSLSGENRASEFLKCYRILLQSNAEKEKDMVEKQQIVSIDNVASRDKLYLHKISCHSIRGIDSYGETFVYSFEGKSNLIYGPNGSGKSSLLSAVNWVFTNQTITDAAQDVEKTGIHKTTGEAKKGSKICDWPIIATLPDIGNPGSVIPDSWVEIELKTKKEEHSIYLKRSLEKGLESSVDQASWKPCKDLLQYGISPLDIQISLVAPTLLSRRTIDEANDVMQILSLILGYDSLDLIGKLATDIARNRTVFSGTKKKEIETAWDTVKLKLESLANILIGNSAIKKQIDIFAQNKKPTGLELKTIENTIAEEINHANEDVATILGITVGDTIILDGLAEKLIETIAVLEKDFSSVFPSFSAINLKGVFKAEDKLLESLDEINSTFWNFIESSKERIADRLKWWKKETEPNSKASLLIHAAQYYNPDDAKCPVCDQSIKELQTKDALSDLKGKSDDLLRKVSDFFNDLSGELDEVFVVEIRDVSKFSPIERADNDWKGIRQKFDSRLAGCLQQYEKDFQKIKESMQNLEVIDELLLPKETDEAFCRLAESFIEKVKQCYQSLATLKWSQNYYDGVKKQLDLLITDISAKEPPSLVSVLSQSKNAAQEIQPLGIIQRQLREITNDRKNIVTNEELFALLEKLEMPLDRLKALSKYALDKTKEIFDEIKDKADGNLVLLYEESPTGLKGSKLIIERGKIESILSHDSYEVAGKYFANAGFQRAIALSFLCALLGRHSGGLGFVAFDDPILSLDEDHREKWADRILAPFINEEMQVILTTHQEHFKTNCQHDFETGKVIELNPRDRKQPLSWQPGDSLFTIEKTLEVNWKAVPNLLRKYCERVLITFQAYSTEDFYNPTNYSKSRERYKSLKAPNPLAGPRRDQIANALEKAGIDRVLDPGSHAMTEDDLTKPMVRMCLDQIRSDIHGNVKNEIQRLKNLRRRMQGGKIILPKLPARDVELKESKIFHNSITIGTVGRAAARKGSWVVESSEEVVKSLLKPFSFAHVLEHTFDPVARCGQYILISQEDDIAVDGDLVAAELCDGTRYLRRIAVDGDTSLLYSINPMKAIPPVQIRNDSSRIHKVLGVVYESSRLSKHDKVLQKNEWYPYENFETSFFDNLHMIMIEGDSLDPIARQGQRVLVNIPKNAEPHSIEDGGLAVIETQDEIGCVIKRVFKKNREWILVSANTMAAYPPDIIPIEKIEKVWPLCGVIFEIL